MPSLKLSCVAAFTAVLALAGSSCSGKARSGGGPTPPPDAGGAGSHVAGAATGGAPPPTAGAGGAGSTGGAGGTGGATPEPPPCEDPMTCGECGVCGADPGASPFTSSWSCVNGACVANCYAGTGDCDGKPGCEGILDTADNCGQCGRKACAAAGTLLTCDAGDRACTSPVCAPGFANCDLTSPDCETSLGTAISCFPDYGDTIKHRTRSVFPVVAMAPDGSVYLGGDLDEKDDFDPTAGEDQGSIGPDGAAFITKLNPDGSYAWTRTFDAGFLLLQGLAADANGVVAVGVYHDSVDFDPGAGVALQTASGNSIDGDSFIVKLTPAGQYSWAHNWSAADPLGRVSASSVVLSGGDVYFGGAHSGTNDFDPGAGQSLLSAESEQGVVGKLDASGHFVWVRQLQGVTSCSGWVLAMTAAPGGRIWVTGSRQGPCTFGSSFPELGSRAYVAAFDPDGELFGEWALAAAADNARSISAAADGSIFVGGSLNNLDGSDADLDPGPGVDMRSPASGNIGFVTKLAPDGSYVWSQLMGGGWVTVAATPDGGVLASGLAPDLRFVSKLRADGTAAWSLGFFAAGDDFHLAAGEKGFVVAGVVDHGELVDFNPWASTPELGTFNGQTTFFSRYTY